MCLSEYQRRASPLPFRALLPWRQRGRCAPISQKARGHCNLGPKDHIFHQTVIRLPVANHMFLGSWTVHIHQECHSPRSAPRGDTQHTWNCALVVHPGNGAARTGEVHKTHNPPGTVFLPSTWSPEHVEPGKGTKHTAHWALCLCRVFENLSG